METRKPYVTELLDLLNKPALMNWSNKIGLEGISLKEFRKKAFDKGLSIHKQIEQYIKEKKAFKDIEVQTAFEKFMRYKKVISVEEVVENEMFIGRYDIELKFQGKTFICDWKSSSGIYLENILQLTAYRMAKQSWNSGIAIVKVPEFSFNPINIWDYEPYEQILQSLSEIYRAKEKVSGLIKMFQIENWKSQKGGTK